MEYNDGNIYEGDWYQDQRHGRGKFIWNKLDVARMEFYDGQVRFFFNLLPKLTLSAWYCLCCLILSVLDTVCLYYYRPQVGTICFDIACLILPA